MLGLGRLGPAKLLMLDDGAEDLMKRAALDPLVPADKIFGDQDRRVAGDAVAPVDDRRAHGELEQELALAFGLGSWVRRRAS